MKRLGPLPAGQLKDLFHIDPETHDDGAKDFLGERGHFDGIEPTLILARPQTSRFIAKLYRYFVRMNCHPRRGAAWPTSAQSRLRRRGISRRAVCAKIFMPVQASTSRARGVSIDLQKNGFETAPECRL